MKNFKLLQKLVFFMVFGLTLCTLQACSSDEDNSPKHKLVGAWERKFSDGRFEIYEFDKDGTFSKIVLFGETQEGRYTLNNKLGTLTLSYFSGGTSTWLLTELNNSYFIIMSTSNASSYTYNRREVDPKGTYDTFTSVKVSGHEAVDLGLSVKWATCNVGASSWEGEGDRFAWGETSTKTDEYNRENYKWATPDEYDYYGNIMGFKYIKYCTDSDYGTVDNKTTLDAYDDAATAKWGGNWRMPTKEEVQELFDNCSFVSTRRNGVSGCYVIGKNRNYIFLPYEDYWTSTLDNDDNEDAYMYISSSSLYNKGRWNDCVIRAVCK